METARLPESGDILDIPSLGSKNSPQVKTAVLHLITTLLGIWLRLSIDDIIMRRMSGAMTNSVYMIDVAYAGRAKLDHCEPTKMLLRIYGQGIDWMFSRRRELECTQRLAEAGIAPKWLGIFGNGRFEEFVRNVPVTSDMIRDPEISAKIARKLFHLHHNSSLASDVDVDELQKGILWKRLAAWKLKAIEALRLMQKSDHPLHDSPFLPLLLDLGLDSDEFDNMIKSQKASCKSIHSPIVLCHNDLHMGNVMIKRDDDSVILIDFEYAALSPRGFDIANHFCEWAADYESDNPEALDFSQRLPDTIQQMNFINAYSEESALNGKCVDPSQLLQEAFAFMPISHLLWAHWGIIQASKSYIQFDYLRYAHGRISEFLRLIQ